MGNYNSSTGSYSFGGVDISSKVILSDQATYKLYAIEAVCVFVLGYVSLTELTRLFDTFL